MTIKWPGVLAHAKRIVNSYDTPVTLRQLFYRLVADGTIENTLARYTTLSARTAEARRAGTFPDLYDRTATIVEPFTFGSASDGVDWLREIYKRDRTEGQPYTIQLAVEKAGLSAQLNFWFTELYGIPHAALGGFASQYAVSKIVRSVEAQGRPAILIYAGDFDPSGEEIYRDFVDRSNCWDETIKVALHPAQIAAYSLPDSISPDVMRKLERDTRARAFLSRHGSLQQVEVDALDPNVLRDLYQDAIDRFWDQETYEDVLRQEESDRQELSAA
jgi:hypothetical protein